MRAGTRNLPNDARERTHRMVKRRAPLGQLRNLTHDARELLHGWFREDGGFITYREVARSLKKHFDITVGLTTLSDYYRQKREEIVSPAAPENLIDGEVTAAAQTIVVRIEIPAGSRVRVASEAITANAEGAE